MVQSINEEENQLDFAAAMDWLERESKTGNSLVIDLTRPGDDDFSSDDSSASSEHNSDDSDYMEGGGDSKLRHKKRTSHNKQKTPDKGNSPDKDHANLNILSSVCGDIIGETLNDDKEEISVNESNKSNTNIPDDLFHGLNGKSLHNDEVEDEGVKVDNNIKTTVVDSRRSKILTNHYRVLQRVNKMTCYKLKGRMAKNNQIKMAVEDSRRCRSHNNFTVLARLGKTLCLKVKGNDCGKRRRTERRGTGSGKRTRRVITNPTETTKKKTQQMRSKNEEKKRRKRRSSHLMVFDLTFYTDPL